MKNFIPINRNIFNHYLWNEKREFSKFEAWLDLLQLVSYKDGNSTIINGKLIKWDRGSYPVSYSFLEKRWCWTTSKIRTFLNSIENDKMIARQLTRGVTMLTICKYDSYNIQSQTHRKVNSKQIANASQQLNKVNKDKKEIMRCWLMYRKQIKKPILNPSTLEKLVNKFNSEDLKKVTFVVNQSIENNWQGLFWDQYNPNKHDGVKRLNTFD